MNKVYEIVNEQILAALEAGVVPWKKSWTAIQHQSIHRHEYTGINRLLTAYSAIHQGFTSPFWVTFKKAKELGGSVKKGEKSTIVVFWKFLKKLDKEGKEVTFPLLRYYRVFNTDQCELPEGSIPSLKAVVHDHSPIEACENIVSEMPNKPEIAEGNQGVAAYYPSLDKITMPEMKLFDSPEAYYSTLFHELGHSTGHASRTGRLSGEEKESMDGGRLSSYAKEELVAEMTAAFLCGAAGIQNESLIENSASYISGWSKRIKDDPKMLVTACGKAEKASDYILNRKQEKEVEVETAACA